MRTFKETSDINLVVHLGLHKTASSFLQRRFFDLYAKEASYINVRAELKEFRNYVLFTNALNYKKSEAIDLFFDVVDLENLPSNRLTISDEMFCGNPFQDASHRKIIVDRLVALFPKVKFAIVFRNQEALVQSLYLQYVKAGGCASPEQFINDKNESLSFSRSAYLDFGSYLTYLYEAVGKERVKCLLYEDLGTNAVGFVTELAEFIGFSIDGRFDCIREQKVNKSLSVSACCCLRFVNKLSKSYRQPYQLLPQLCQVWASRILVRLSGKSSQPIRSSLVVKFCARAREKNLILAKSLNRELDKLGY